MSWRGPICKCQKFVQNPETRLAWLDHPIPWQPGLCWCPCQSYRGRGIVNCQHTLLAMEEKVLQLKLQRKPPTKDHSARSTCQMLRPGKFRSIFFKTCPVRIHLHYQVDPLSTVFSRKNEKAPMTCLAKPHAVFACTKTVQLRWWLYVMENTSVPVLVIWRYSRL